MLKMTTNLIETIGLTSLNIVKEKDELGKERYSLFINERFMAGGIDKVTLVNINGNRQLLMLRYPRQFVAKIINDNGSLSSLFSISTERKGESSEINELDNMEIEIDIGINTELYVCLNPGKLFLEEESQGPSLSTTSPVADNSKNPLSCVKKGWNIITKSDFSIVLDSKRYR